MSRVQRVSSVGVTDCGQSCGCILGLITSVLFLILS